MDKQKRPLPESEGAAEAYPQVRITYREPSPLARLCSNPACRANLDKCRPDVIESTPIDDNHHIEFCSVECSKTLYLKKEMEYYTVSSPDEIWRIFEECNVPPELPTPKYIKVRYYWLPWENQRGRVRDIYYPVGDSAYVRIDCDEV